MTDQNNTQTARTKQDDQLDDQLAAMMAPPDSKYLLICRECRKVWPYKRDCKTTKAARRGTALCPECDSVVDMPVDAQEAEA